MEGLKGFTYGRRNETAEHHWENLQLQDVQVTRPMVLVFGGDGTKTDEATNGNVKIVESLLGVFKDDADVIGVNYNNSFRKNEDIEESIKQLIEQVFMPLISNNGKRIDAKQACKNMRNITIFAHCFGDFDVTTKLVDMLSEILQDLKYLPEENDKILEQIFMISYGAPYCKIDKKIKTFRVLSGTDDMWLDPDVYDWTDLKQSQDVKISKIDKEELENLPTYSDGEVKFFKFYDNKSRCFILKRKNEIRVATANLSDDEHDHSIGTLMRKNTWEKNDGATKAGDYTSRCVASALCHSVANSILNGQYEELLPMNMDDLQAELEHIVEPLNFEKSEIVINKEK